MKPVCIIDRDALDLEDVKKLEDEGCMVLRVLPGRRCEMWIPPLVLTGMEVKSGVN